MAGIRHLIHARRERLSVSLLYARYLDAAARKTAHTLLDFHSGFVGSEAEADKMRSFATSMGHLNEEAAIVATQDDKGNLALDFTPVLLASGVSYQWLFTRLAAATGRAEAALAFELREFIDGQLDD